MSKNNFLDLEFYIFLSPREMYNSTKQTSGTILKKLFLIRMRCYIVLFAIRNVKRGFWKHTPSHVSYQLTSHTSSLPPVPQRQQLTVQLSWKH